MLPFKIVIPARYGSTRLPGKPLKTLNGKTLIEHVYIAASKTDADEIIVATDNQKIIETVEAFGGVAMLTHDDHQSGTDRINEVATRKEWSPSTVVVNLQGDEPLVQTQNIHALVKLLNTNLQADMATLVVSSNKLEDIINPNNIKVVLDNNNFALYFSRAPIPWLRDSFNDKSLSQPAGMQTNTPFHLHIGLYAYQVKTLQQFSSLPASLLEQAESLEQLRILSNGMKIIVQQTTDVIGHGVDTPEDLILVENILKNTS